jgi:Rieske Fe-S protein
MQALLLDTFLDQLIEDRRPVAHTLTVEDLADRLLAAQLRLAAPGRETPAQAFLDALERRTTGTPGREQHRRHESALSRRRVLRMATRTIAAASLAGVGIATNETVRHRQSAEELVMGAGHWYDVAAVDEVAAGQMKAFDAGGILGYLVNDGQHLHALSAICTHGGCRLRPEKDSLALRCLCHGARFSADGAVRAGPARVPLPRLALRTIGGRIYAQGTTEGV